jgi:hypothetical protein
MTTDAPRTGDSASEHGAEPVLNLIKRIKEHQIDPIVLDVEDRRRCVEVLWAEGYSAGELAQILKCSERTIFRDRAERRAANALRVDSQFAPQMAGELIRQAEASIGRLRRIAREATASAMERLMAENFAFKAHLDLIGKLQSMGYLPRIPNGIVAQVVGAAAYDVIPTLDQLGQRLNEIAKVDRELGLENPEHMQRLRMLEEQVDRRRLAAEVSQLFDRPANDN